MPHDDPPWNAGKILTDRHVALYRDQERGLHAISSVCPHTGCDVRWNDLDKVWAYPRHGSRFAPEGDVIHGPAMKLLPPVEIPEQE